MHTISQDGVSPPHPALSRSWPKSKTRPTARSDLGTSPFQSWPVSVKPTAHFRVRHFSSGHYPHRPVRSHLIPCRGMTGLAALGAADFNRGSAGTWTRAFGMSKSCPVQQLGYCVGSASWGSPAAISPPSGRSPALTSPRCACRAVGSSQGDELRHSGLAFSRSTVPFRSRIMGVVGNLAALHLYDGTSYGRTRRGISSMEVDDAVDAPVCANCARPARGAAHLPAETSPSTGTGSGPARPALGRCPRPRGLSNDLVVGAGVQVERGPEAALHKGYGQVCDVDADPVAFQVLG